MKNNQFIVLAKCFLSILLIYLIFIPFFYIYNLKGSVLNLIGSVLMFIIINVLRLSAIILAGLFFRRKYNSTIKENRNLIILLLFIVVILLHCMDIPGNLYAILTGSLGIYDILAENLFLIISTEQLFNNYLILSFLICTAIVFFKPFTKTK